VNLSTLSRSGALAAALSLSLAASVLAEERFELKGTHAERGAFRSEVTLDVEGKHVRVQRQVWWSDGSTSLYRGVLPHSSSVIEGRLEAAGGAAGAIQGRAAEGIRFAFRYGEPSQAKALDARGPSKAIVVKEEIPKAIVVQEEIPKAVVVQEDEPKEEPSLYEKAKGRLIGLAKKEAEKALRKGASTGIDLADYGHVGIRAKIERVENLSANQRQALQRGPSVWVASEYQGAARVGTSGSVDLGGVGVGIGIRAGTELNYRVVERYELRPGQGVKDRIRDLGKQAWEAHTLPLSASEARELELGAARTLSGQWNVVLSGSMSVGDPVEGRVSLGGSYQYRDHFRLDVERLAEERVRVALVRTKTHSLSGSLKAVVGVAVEGRLEEYVPASAHFVTKKIADEAEDYLRVELKVSGGAAWERDFELGYELDLSDAKQARAYERAVLGDWRQAQASGRLLIRRVGFERRRHSKVALGISKLASFKWTSSTTRSEDRILDAEGEREERAVTLIRGKKSEWFGNEEEHSFTAEGLWTIRPGGRDLAIRLHYRSKDEWTRESEFRRLRGALIAAGFPQAGQLQPGEDEVRAELELRLDEAGLKLLGGTSRERALRAYAISVEAITGKAQQWLDPAKRSRIRLATKLVPGSKRRTKRYPTQRRHLLSAERFAKALAALGAARTQAEREERFLGLAKRSRWELFELSAMARLVGGPAHAEVSGSLGGREFR
jgi:hypothetical protein